MRPIRIVDWTGEALLERLGAKEEAAPAPETVLPIGGILQPIATTLGAIVGAGDPSPHLPARAHADRMSIPRATIYVVIPTLNESRNLGDVVRGIDRSLAGQPYGILVVDDASTDGTRGVILSLKQAGYPLKSLDRDEKLGIGSAIRDGLEWCLRETDADRLITMDADLSHNPAEIPNLLGASANADLVQGSRYISGGHILNWSWHRRLLSLLANYLAQVLLDTGIREHTTYFRAYSRRAAEAAIVAEGCKSYEWSIESLLEILRAGLAVKEVPITFHERERGASKLNSQAMVGWLLYVLAAGAENRHLGVLLGRLLRFLAIWRAGPWSM